MAAPCVRFLSSVAVLDVTLPIVVIPAIFSVIILLGAIAHRVAVDIQNKNERVNNNIENIDKSLVKINGILEIPGQLVITAKDKFNHVREVINEYDNVTAAVRYILGSKRDKGVRAVTNECSNIKEAIDDRCRNCN